MLKLRGRGGALSLIGGGALSFGGGGVLMLAGVVKLSWPSLLASFELGGGELSLAWSSSLTSFEWTCFCFFFFGFSSAAFRWLYSSTEIPKRPAAF